MSGLCVITIRRRNSQPMELPYGQDHALMARHLDKLLRAHRAGWPEVRLNDRDGEEICTVLMRGVERIHAGVVSGVQTELDTKSDAAGERAGA